MRKSLWVLSVVLFCVATQADAGFLKDRIQARLAKKETPETIITRDVHYGANRAQAMDIYAREGVKNAPAIIMVHGGGWKRGDKKARGVVDNKIAHFLPKGFVFISLNYRMLPEAGPYEQAKDIAKAVSYIQRNGGNWGVDPDKLVLMGHSAGAHLVALLGAAPALVYAEKGKKWLGTIALDSAALNVETIMQADHYALYDEAFGPEQGYWQMASPYHQLNVTTQPYLLVCSTRRAVACEQAKDFKAKVNQLDGAAGILPLDLSHAEINDELGLEGPYTAAVDKFLTQIGATP